MPRNLLRYYAQEDGWHRHGRPTINPNPDPAWDPYWGLPVFRDEFEPGTVLSDKWNVRHNFLTMDAARGMRENAILDNGQLILRGKWLQTPEIAGPKGIITHTTGYIDTRPYADSANPVPKTFSQQWGRWQVRCQTPTGPNTRGALAAFWLRNDQGKLGEIDILEAWGGAPTMPNKATYDTYVYGTGYTTFHSNTNGSSAADYRKVQFRHFQGVQPAPRTVWQEMHTYTFDRTPDYMAMWVDDRLIFNVTPSTPDPTPGAGDTLAWLWNTTFFGSPLHIRMNLHVGPSETFYGLPDPNNRQWTSDPLDFRIEFVRAYALPEGA